LKDWAGCGNLRLTCELIKVGPRYFSLRRPGKDCGCTVWVSSIPTVIHEDVLQSPLKVAGVECTNKDLWALQVALKEKQALNHPGQIALILLDGGHKV